MMKHESLQTKLEQFHTAFGHPIDLDYPRISKSLDRQRQFRRKLIEEEYEEVINAIDTKKPDDVLKELCDLVYVCIGFATTYGWAFDTAFNRVHLSNMSKLDKEGNPIYREDGKVSKSDCYQPPKLKDLV
tara:strand:- start:139 stop:528 length:390 start_codon:yes stop_codon:yes gene_type:complete